MVGNDSLTLLDPVKHKAVLEMFEFNTNKYQKHSKQTNIIALQSTTQKG